MFILRNKLLGLILLGIGAGTVTAEQRQIQLPSGSPLLEVKASKPAIFRNDKYIWLEYCPDNTCDVLRSRNKLDAATFEAIASAYLYYFSTYSYLDEWKADPARGDLIDAKIFALSTKLNCNEGNARSRARCAIASYHKSSGLRFLFVRFDEGRGISKFMSIDEALN